MHAVIIVDMCESKQGEKLLLIAQSYMPAQDIHILKNTAMPQLGAWHKRSSGNFHIAEWNFHSKDLHCSNRL